jgi:hypothetical protein
LGVVGRRWRVWREEKRRQKDRGRNKEDAREGMVGSRWPALACLREEKRRQKDRGRNKEDAREGMVGSRWPALACFAGGEEKAER